MIAITFIYPMSLYWNVGIDYFPAVSLFFMFLAITYTFILFDTLVNCVVNRDVLKLTLKKTVTKKTTVLFLKKWCLIFVISNAISVLNGMVFHLPYVLIIAIIFVIIIALNNIINRMTAIWPIALTLGIILCFVQTGGIIKIIVNIVVVTTLFFLGRVIHVFNYKFIKAEHVEAGMIISGLSIQEMIKYEGCDFLINKKNESMKDRINREEADLIRNSGYDMVRIVRKMPFALFLVFSIIVYLTMEMIYAN